jgi:hypothetical protein
MLSKVPALLITKKHPHKHTGGEVMRKNLTAIDYTNFLNPFNAANNLYCCNEIVRQWLLKCEFFFCSNIPF